MCVFVCVYVCLHMCVRVCVNMCVYVSVCVLCVFVQIKQPSYPSHGPKAAL